MGTNYYARLNICEECGRDDELHLGKSSVGWKFMFRVNKSQYKNFKEFCQFIKKKGVYISDEYCKPITPKYLIDLIKSKQQDLSHFDKYGDGDLIDNYEFYDYEFS